MTKKPDLTALLAEAKDYAQHRTSRATNQAHDYDWKVFADWCKSAKVKPLPAATDTILMFLADQAKTKKMATLLRYKSSISVIHKEADHPSPFAVPAVEHMLEGMRRQKGMAQEGRDALDYDAVASAELGDDVATIRNRALVLFGFMTALRGTEICALDMDDLEFVDEGVIVTVRKSKTDQHRTGRVVSVPRSKTKKTCPVRALEKWLDTLVAKHAPVGPLRLHRGYPVDGPVFRTLSRAGAVLPKRVSRGTVWEVVKDLAKRAGLEGDYGAHSLRAGYVTRAHENGVGWDAIRAQTGHKGDIVRRYSRHTQDPFVESQSLDVLDGAKKGKKR
jgi:integrase